MICGSGGKRTNRQLDAWTGRFGDEYTERNVVDWSTRLPLFQEMLKGLRLRRILEVGCNRGHNLLALSRLAGEDARVVGIEPNSRARALARALNPGAPVLAGESYHLPFHDSVFDLVLTWGVLIHVPLAKLPTALAEIWRVAARHILAVEYFAEAETTIQYRGHNDLLWKRDFLQHYKTQFPGLGLLRKGYWGEKEHEDRVSWWLLERSSSGHLDPASR